MHRKTQRHNYMQTDYSVYERRESVTTTESIKYNVLNILAV